MILQPTHRVLIRSRSQYAQLSDKDIGSHVPALPNYATADRPSLRFMADRLVLSDESFLLQER